MPRANRFFLPGCIWHITHRCHKKEFLLKFSRDRRRWLAWLSQAKKRYGLQILNYMVTSNHIHLLVLSEESRDTIPRSIQLAAGRTAQEYNYRKKRKGAFWEDRYHATAIQKDQYLFRCMIYIDLNMVRAGVVNHPIEWPFCGYTEIQNHRQKSTLISYPHLLQVLEIKNRNELKKLHNSWIEKALRTKNLKREKKWTENIAVGSSDFIKDIKKRLGIKAEHRRIFEENASFMLHEERSPYGVNFRGKNANLKRKFGRK